MTTVTLHFLDSQYSGSLIYMINSQVIMYKWLFIIKMCDWILANIMSSDLAVKQIITMM